MKKTALCLTLFFLSLLTLPSWCENAKYRENQIYVHTLKNGMKVITVERHMAPLIYHQLTYRVGSRNEHLGITGISHVVEHMMFKGTSRYPKGQASRTISLNAGIFNAFTANDMTSYFEYLPKDRVDVAFDIESDRMSNCIFDEREFASEISVIRQERRMRVESNPQGIIRENLNSTAFMSSPERDPIIGWPSDLARLTRNDAFDYYKKYYHPGNAFLVLVGDFSTDEMVIKADKYYGSIPAGPMIKDFTVCEQPQIMKKTLSFSHNDIASQQMQMVFHAPALSERDSAALRVAAQILGARSRSARLYRRLIEDKNIASSALAGMPIAKDPTLFRISVSMMKDRKIEEAEPIVWDEIAGMQKSPVTDHELQKVKNVYVYGQAVDYVKNSDIGGRISTYEDYAGYQFIEEFTKRVLAVTKEDVKRVMQSYFSPEKATIVYSYPGNPKAQAPVNADQEGRNDDAPHLKSLEDITDPPCFFDKEGVKPDQITPGTASRQSFPDPPPIAPLIRKSVLSNGIALYTVENHLSPTLYAGGFFTTGLIEEEVKDKKAGITSFLALVSNRGTRKTGYDDLTERMAFVPYSFSMDGSYRGISFQGQSLTKDAGEMLKTGVDMIVEPGLREKDIEKIRARFIDSVKKRFTSTSEKAFFNMFNTIFANHPYAMTEPDVSSLSSITREDLAALHDKYVDARKLTLFFVGDMSHKEMAALAEKHFKAVPARPGSAAAVPVPAVKPLDTRTVKVFPQKEYTECTINIGFSPRNGIDPEKKECADVLNQIYAASALTSRLGTELRDKRGLIYGLKSQLWDTSDGIGYWKLQTKTAPEHTEEAISVIFSETERLLKEGVTEQELTGARNRLCGLLPFSIETPDDIAGIAIGLIRKKLPFESFDRKGARLRAVTRDDVLAIARSCLTLDRCAIVVDGPIEEHSLDNLQSRLPR